MKFANTNAMRNGWIVWIMIVLASVGFADAGYLTIEHLRHGEVTCSFFGGCDLVTGSEYGEIGPVPTSALGVVYYGVVLIGLMLARARRSDRLVRSVAWFSAVGLGASIGFVYLQLVVLRAICIFCMASAVTSTLLFVFGMTVLLLQRGGSSEGISRET